MCGSYSNYDWRDEPDIDRSPIWRRSKDGKHVKFYAHYGSSCKPAFGVGATDWCQDHCYMERLPPPIKWGCDEKRDPSYELSWFLESPCDDFLQAEFVTFFASGGLHEFYIDEDKIVKALTSKYPEKVFRFFTRSENCGSRYFKSNAVVLFSLDIDTPRKRVDYAINSNAIDGLAIVEHPDNKYLIEDMQHRLPVIRCIDCQKGKQERYLCFHQKEKFLVLMNYQ